MRVERACASPAAAEALRESVAADTPDFVRLSVEGATLVIELTAESAASARASLDDLLACLRAAERTAGD